MGIGTTGPDSKLEVADSSAFDATPLRLSNDITASSPISISILFDGVQNNDVERALGGITMGHENVWTSSASSNDSYILFKTSLNRVISEKVRITSAGNVGIGTTAPTERLEVNGTIKGTDIKISGGVTIGSTALPSGYNLMPLNELDAYIASNGRLPEVPSSEEVAANGISLGASQALLLKKIEELTLYMIEMQQENVVLRERLGELEEK